MQSDAEYLRGFALFMSELFVHMNNKEENIRFRVLGRAVRELLLTFLEHPTPGNVKCVCQILKVRHFHITFTTTFSSKLIHLFNSIAIQLQLSGCYIEDDDRQANQGQALEMDNLMAKIDTVARTVDMQMHMKGASFLSDYYYSQSISFKCKSFCLEFGL